MCLAACAQRCEQNRGDGQYRQHRVSADVAQHVDTEYVSDHPQETEHAGFHDGDRVQQRAHGCRRHHRDWEPSVQRHDRGLDAEPEHKETEQSPDGFAWQPRWQHPAGTKFSARRQRVHPDDGKQQRLAGGQRVDKIPAAAGASLVGAIVRDERIGRERQDLVKKEEGQQVRRKRESDGRGHAQRETREIPRLIPIPASPHVPDRIDRGHQPQHGGDQGEQQTEWIGAQMQGDPGDERQRRRFKRPTSQPRRHHRQHQAKLDDSRAERTALAQGGPPTHDADQDGCRQ